MSDRRDATAGAAEGRTRSAALEPGRSPGYLSSSQLLSRGAGEGQLPAQMGGAAAVEFVVGIAHRVGAALAEHDLEIHRFEALVLEAVDHPRRAGDAFPRAEPAPQLPAALVLDEHGEGALQDEEHLLDLMGMCGVALPRRAIDDAQGEGARRNDARVVMLARAAGADEAMLGAAVALNLGVLEGFPIGCLVAKPADIALG